MTKATKQKFSVVVLWFVIFAMFYGIGAMATDAINATHDAIMLG